MKKSTLACAAALACITTTAMAQTATPPTSVTLYGLADAGINYVTGLKQGSVTQLTSGNMEGTRWGMKGNEDLGGGMRAIFVLESRVELDTGSVSNRPASASQVPDRLNTASQMGLISPLMTAQQAAQVQGAVTAVAANLGSTLGVNLEKNLFDRQAYVGLVTPVGAITAGRQYTPGYLAQGAFDSMHTESSLAAGQLVSVPASFTIRTSNSLQYGIQTGGVTATVMYAMGEVAGNNSANRLLGTMVIYKGAGFSVGGGYNTQKNEVGQKSLTNAILGASADLGPGTLSTMFVKIKDDNPANVSGISTLLGGTATAVAIQNAFTTALKQDSTLFHIGYRMNMGANTVTVAYNAMNDKTASNADRASYGVAYSYALSKRTDLNAVLTRVNNKNTSQLSVGGNGFLGGVTSAAGADSTNVMFGIRHRF